MFPTLFAQKMSNYNIYSSLAFYLEIFLDKGIELEL